MDSSFEDFKEKVKYEVDIVDIVSEYVNLEKVGKNYRALCPFHQENTPSFTINPRKQFYYCFGCSTGGDVFNFLMEIENITFKESLKILAERAGLELPSRNKYQNKVNKQRDKIFKMNELASKFYHYLLLNNKIGDKALEYLQKRGFEKNDIEKFKLGYAPDRWKSLMKFLLKKGYTKEELKKAGLVQYKNNNYYDRFRGRIIFPIFNPRGEVLAFGARLLNESNSSMPKYLNSPGTMIYSKGDNLYGINWAKNNIRKKNEAIIMEGYTDVLTAYSAGIKNTVASLGTSLTLAQARLLKRYTDMAFIAYDADAAGTNATLRGLDILKNSGLEVKVIELPEDTDPDDYIKENGTQKFKNLQTEAVNLMDFKINQIIQDEQIESSEDKISLSNKLIQLLINLDSAIEKDIYVEKIAGKLNLDENSIKKELNKIETKENENKNKKSGNQRKKKQNNNRSNNLKQIQKNILKVFINRPEYRDKIKNEIKVEYFNGVYKNAAKWLFFNCEENISSKIENIDDEKCKNLIMSITVKENNEENISLSTLDFWISKLKEDKINKYKKKIYKKLKTEDVIGLKRLNKLLVNYKGLIR